MGSGEKVSLMVWEKLSLKMDNISKDTSRKVLLKGLSVFLLNLNTVTI